MTLAARVAMRMARYFILFVEEKVYVCAADSSGKNGIINMNAREANWMVL